MTGASCTVLDEQGNDVTTHSADLNMTFNDLSFKLSRPLNLPPVGSMTSPVPTTL